MGYRLLLAIRSGSLEMVEYALAGSKFPHGSECHELAAEACKQGVAMVRLLSEKYQISFSEYAYMVWGTGDIDLVQYLHARGTDFASVSLYRPSHWKVYRWGIEQGFTCRTMQDEDVTALLAFAMQNYSSPLEEILAFEYAIFSFGLDRVDACIRSFPSRRVIPRRGTLEMLCSLGILLDSPSVFLFGTFDAIKYYFEELALPLPHKSEIKKACRKLGASHWFLMPPEILLYWNMRKRDERVAQARTKAQKKDN